MRRHLKPLFTLLLLAFSSALQAAPLQGPVYIEADHVEVDERKGISTFLGNVHMTRDSLIIDADKVWIYRKEGTVEKAVAEGQPARYQQTEDSGQQVRAEAQHMEYFTADEKLHMEGDAHLWRDKNEFSGDRIVYDIRGEQVLAAGKESGQDRVRAIIYPEDQTEQGGESPQQ